ncbi:hypothetical protein AVEN_73691-1 [Araneus ventricosus]|uniref:Uncharacterized protein n=1 Tax=Araneus ventricosus TaxID=182803 RepID=A0A4Y2HQN3_ARAVE|nr:hypothetical protein AVEN_73691-1 [Araneus ventricosus]
MSNAPFLDIRTLQQLAEDEKSRYPLAYEVLLHDAYLDDIVRGAHDRETARRLKSQLQGALQTCGMNLHKHQFEAKPFQDRFVFKVSISIKPSYTKLEVLSVIAAQYDPLSFLGPVLTREKVLMQRLWQERLDWMMCCPVQSPMSIRSSLRLEISNIVLHTDSTIALAWLNTPANHLKTFIANRVSKVQRLMENCCWTHVPSPLNPADLVPRGLSPRDLPELKLWWSGPPFLERDELSSGPGPPLMNESEYYCELKSSVVPVFVFVCQQIVICLFYLIYCV